MAVVDSRTRGLETYAGKGMHCKRAKSLCAAYDTYGPLPRVQGFFPHGQARGHACTMHRACTPSPGVQGFLQLHGRIHRLHLSLCYTRCQHGREHSHHRVPLRVTTGRETDHRYLRHAKQTVQSVVVDVDYLGMLSRESGTVSYVWFVEGDCEALPGARRATAAG